MTLLKKVIFISLFIVSLSAQSLFLSGGLTSKYGDGIQPGVGEGDTLRNPFFYREHLIDLNGSYGNFSLWTNLEFSSPPQIGPSQFGLRKFRLTWQKDNLTFQVGDLYGQVGNGLGLNMWESQGIDWDSTLRGAWFRYNKFNSFSIDLLTGVSRTGYYLAVGPGIDPRNRDFISESKLNSLVITKQNIFKGLTLGAYAINVKNEDPWFTKYRDFATGEYISKDSTVVESASKLTGLFTEYFGINSSFYFEYTTRNHELTDVDSLKAENPFPEWIHYDESSKGRSMYGSFSYYPGRWGITIDFKDYLYDESNPEIRKYLPYRLHKRTPTQNPPTVLKEHSAVLLSRIPHVTDFEDEIGFQVEFNFELMKNLFLVMNYAHSNRHSYYINQTDTLFVSEWMKVEKKNDIIDQLSENYAGYYPFSESYSELNYYFNPLNLDLKLSYSVISDIEPGTFVNYITDLTFGDYDQLVNEGWTKFNFRTIPSQLSLDLFGDWGLTAYSEHQWETDEFRTYLAYRKFDVDSAVSVITDTTIINKFYNRYLSLNLTKRSNFSVGIIYDWSPKIKSGDDLNTNPKNDSWLEEILREQFKMDLTNKWFGVQGNYYFTPSTVITAFFGSVQGGLKCDSGVCVYVPGIEDALMLTLTSSF
tara:strand:+ start:12832 stop:14766 length:1935 start_codon:yes stop_codon:yes gene_type:complete